MNRDRGTPVRTGTWNLKEQDPSPAGCHPLAPHRSGPCAPSQDSGNRKHHLSEKKEIRPGRTPQRATGRGQRSAPSPPTHTPPPLGLAAAVGSLLLTAASLVQVRNHLTAAASECSAPTTIRHRARLSAREASTGPSAALSEPSRRTSRRAGVR